MILSKHRRLHGLIRMSALALVTAMAAHPASAQTVRPCLADDDVSAGVLALVQELASDTSSRAARFRSKLGMSSGDAIGVVHDNAVCDAVTAAAHAAQTRAMIVIKVASSSPRYFAATHLVGLFSAVDVLDENFRLWGTIGLEGGGSPSSAMPARTCGAHDRATMYLLALVQGLAADTSVRAQQLRTSVGTSGSATLSIVHDDAMCDAVTTGTYGAWQREALMVVKSASAPPRYFAAVKRGNGLYGPVLVLDEHLRVVMEIGAEALLYPTVP
jgi:hypothetical protein